MGTPEIPHTCWLGTRGSPELQRLPPQVVAADWGPPCGAMAWDPMCWLWAGSPNTGACERQGHLSTSSRTKAMPPLPSALRWRWGQLVLGSLPLSSIHAPTPHELGGLGIALPPGDSHPAGWSPAASPHCGAAGKVQRVGAGGAARPCIWAGGPMAVFTQRMARRSFGLSGSLGCEILPKCRCL